MIRIRERHRPAGKHLRVLAVVAAFSLFASACGASEGSSTSKKSDTVTIASLLPLTGEIAFVGQDVQHGLDLWAEGHNAEAAKSGLPKVKLVPTDSANQVSVGIQAYQQVTAQNKPDLWVGSLTNIMLGIANMVTRDKAPMMLMLQGTNTVTKSPYFIQTMSSYKNELDGLLPAVIKNGGKRLATITVKDNQAFVDEAERMAAEACPAAGCEVISNTLMAADGSDGAFAAIKAQKGNPDAITVLGNVSSMTPVFEKLKTDGYKGFLFGFSDLGEMVHAGHENLVQGALVSEVVLGGDDASVAKYRADYKAKYKKDPPYYSTVGFSTGQIIGAVLAYLKDKGQEFNEKNLLAGLSEVKAESVLGPLTFGDDRRVKVPVEVAVIKGKSIEPLG